MDSPNLYAYSTNSPFNKTDPTGLCPSCVEIRAELQAVEEFVSTLSPEEQERVRGGRRKGEVAALDVVVSFTPLASDIHDASMAGTGRNWLTQEELSSFDQTIAAASLVVPYLSVKAVKWGMNAGGWIADLVRGQVRNAPDMLAPSIPSLSSRFDDSQSVWRGIREAGDGTSKLTMKQRDQLRAEAREKWQLATGIRAYSAYYEIHHRVPLEWAHLIPEADPNRMANLVGMMPENHRLISGLWLDWKKSLGDRLPTPAEVLEAAIRIDELFADLMVSPK